jgi:hypothetical protein
MTNFLYLNEFGDALLVRHEGESTLHTLQTLVQGLIQYVPTRMTKFDGDVWVNEEGLYEPTFSLNLIASNIAGQRLVGPAVIAKSKGGETVGLSDADLAVFTSDGLYVDDNHGEGYTADDAVAIRNGIVAR